MSNLYNLSQSGMQIFDLLSESVGEITDDIQQRLDQLMLDGPQAIENAAMVVRTLQGNAKQCEEEADRLRERAKAFEAQADKLKQRMTFCLDTAFNGKIKTPLFSIYTSKSADRIVADLVPGITPEILHEERPDLVRVKMELDRTKIVDDYKAGRELPELIVFENRIGGRHVTIR